jgi:hypothetical protein
MGRVLAMNIEQLKAKIAQVDADILKMRSTGTEEKKIFTLVEYKEYLQDELKEAQKRYGNSKRP